MDKKETFCKSYYVIWTLQKPIYISFFEEIMFSKWADKFIHYWDLSRVLNTPGV